MNTYNEAKIKVGCFTLLAISVFCGFLFWIAGGDAETIFGGRERDTYVVQFQDVTGLRRNAVVTLAGRPVGEVVDTRLDGQIAEVVMEVDRDVQIWSNATWSLIQPALIGTAYISLSPGTPDAGAELVSVQIGDRPLVAQQRAEQRHSFGVANTEVGGGLSEVMSESERALRNVNELLEALAQRQDALLDEVEALVSSSRGIMQEIEAGLAGGRVDRITGNIEAITSEAALLMQHNREQLGSLLQHIDSTMVTAETHLIARSEEVGELLRGVTASMDDRLGPLLDNLRDLTGSLESVVSDNDRNLQAMVRNLRETTENLAGFSDRIRANPSLLIFGDSESDAAAADERSRIATGMRDRGRLPIYGKRD